MRKKNNTIIEMHAEREYERLMGLYREAGVEEIRLRIYDSMIRKVAQTHGILEAMRELPTIYYDRRRRARQRETAAGRTRVRYMAQYTSAMQKLNRELLGSSAAEEDDLDDYE